MGPIGPQKNKFTSSRSLSSMGILFLGVKFAQEFKNAIRILPAPLESLQKHDLRILRIYKTLNYGPDRPTSVFINIHQYSSYYTVVDIPRWPAPFTTTCLHTNMTAPDPAHERAGRRP